MAGGELAHELEYSKPGSPPALVLHDGQVWQFDELATGAQPFEGFARRKLYTLEPVLDASTAEWVPALVPEDQAEAVREAAAQRIAELDRMNLTLAGVVDDLKKQRAEHEAATVTAQKVKPPTVTFQGATVTSDPEGAVLELIKTLRLVRDELVRRGAVPLLDSTVVALDFVLEKWTVTK